MLDTNSDDDLYFMEEYVLNELFDQAAQVGSINARRLIEQHIELKRLREMLDDPYLEYSE
jgi:hypothetical protein